MGSKTQLWNKQLHQHQWMPNPEFTCQTQFWNKLQQWRRERERERERESSEIESEPSEPSRSIAVVQTQNHISGHRREERSPDPDLRSTPETSITVDREATPVRCTPEATPIRRTPGVVEAVSREEARSRRRRRRIGGGGGFERNGSGGGTRRRRRRRMEKKMNLSFDQKWRRKSGIHEREREKKKRGERREERERKEMRDNHIFFIF